MTSASMRCHLPDTGIIVHFQQPQPEVLIEKEVTPEETEVAGDALELVLTGTHHLTDNRVHAVLVEREIAHRIADRVHQNAIMEQREGPRTRASHATTYLFCSRDTPVSLVNSLRFYFSSRIEIN